MRKFYALLMLMAFFLAVAANMNAQFLPEENKQYLIKNVTHDKFLDTNGQQAILAESDGSSMSQRFVFEKLTGDYEGAYRIKQVSSGNYFRRSGGANFNNDTQGQAYFTAIDQWADNFAITFESDDLAEGEFYMASKYNGSTPSNTDRYFFYQESKGWVRSFCIVSDADVWTVEEAPQTVDPVELTGIIDSINEYLAKIDPSSDIPADENAEQALGQYGYAEYNALKSALTSAETYLSENDTYYVDDVNLHTNAVKTTFAGFKESLYIVLVDDIVGNENRLKSGKYYIMVGEYYLTAPAAKEQTIFLAGKNSGENCDNQVWNINYNTEYTDPARYTMVSCLEGQVWEDESDGDFGHISNDGKFQNGGTEYAQSSDRSNQFWRNFSLYFNGENYAFWNLRPAGNGGNFSLILEPVTEDGELVSTNILFNADDKMFVYKLVPFGNDEPEPADPAMLNEAISLANEFLAGIDPSSDIPVDGEEEQTPGQYGFDAYTALKDALTAGENYLAENENYSEEDIYLYATTINNTLKEFKDSRRIVLVSDKEDDPYRLQTGRYYVMVGDYYLTAPGDYEGEIKLAGKNSGENRDNQVWSISYNYDFTDPARYTLVTCAEGRTWQSDTEESLGHLSDSGTFKEGNTENAQSTERNNHFWRNFSLYFDGENYAFWNLRPAGNGGNFSLIFEAVMEDGELVSTNIFKDGDDKIFVYKLVPFGSGEPEPADPAPLNEAINNANEFLAGIDPSTDIPADGGQEQRLGQYSFDTYTSLNEALAAAQDYLENNETYLETDITMYARNINNALKEFRNSRLFALVTDDEDDPYRLETGNYYIMVGDYYLTAPGDYEGQIVLAGKNSGEKQDNQVWSVSYNHDFTDPARYTMVTCAKGHTWKSDTEETLGHVSDNGNFKEGNTAVAQSDYRTNQFWRNFSLYFDGENYAFWNLRPVGNGGNFSLVFEPVMQNGVLVSTEILQDGTEKICTYKFVPYTGSSDGIDLIANDSNISVQGGKGVITVTGTDPADKIEIFSTSGLLAGTAKADKETIELQKGIYIVKISGTNNKIVKVIVK